MQNEVINHQVIVEQLVELGYDPATLPPDTIDQFVTELRELYRSGSLGNEVETQEFHRNTNKVVYSTTNDSSIVKNIYQPAANANTRLFEAELQHSDSQSLRVNLAGVDLSNARRQAATQAETRQNFNSTISNKDDDSYVFVDISSSPADSVVDTTITDQESESRRPASGFIRTAPPKRPAKKHDPVSRFHQHKAVWSRDDFLQRTEHKAKAATGGRWGGSTVIPATTSKPRHNLAALRPTYVVPTQKDRRDVIWEIRNRMAIHHS